MNLLGPLLDLIIPSAHAQAAAAPGGAAGGMLGTLALPIIFIAVMYFLMIRPQMKRQKDHRAMLEKLQRGDEVIAGGGIAGTVSEIGDNFVSVEVANGVQLRVQRGAISNVLPKGTLKSA